MCQKQQQAHIVLQRNKKTIALLSIGTFLEYFDLMLYVHMAVLLNELFFPSSDPFTTSLLSAFAFCSTYILRPFGAIVLGYIGDNYGRKVTIIISTTIMAFSCLVMANVGTYAQIGIASSWIVTMCRVCQGLSSLGEIISAEIYLVENLSRPVMYSMVCMVVVASAFGGFAALGIASLTTAQNFNWRWAFWFGALVALIGVIARTTLRESRDFVDAKKQLKNTFKKNNICTSNLSTNPVWAQKIDLRVVISYFFMECTSPVYFYINYIYCADILKSLGLDSHEIIKHNFLLSGINVFNAMLLTFLVSRIHPIRILQYKFIFFVPFILFMPFMFEYITQENELYILQILSIFLCCTAFPANSVIFTHFPILQRFTYSTFAFAIAKAITYCVTAFGVSYLYQIFNHVGLLILLVPINIGYFFAMQFFKKREIVKGNYLM